MLFRSQQQCQLAQLGILLALVLYSPSADDSAIYLLRVAIKRTLPSTTRSITPRARLFASIPPRLSYSSSTNSESPTTMSAQAPRDITTWASKDGEFRRLPSTFRSHIEVGGEFPPEKNRYMLYVSLACPWAHRTLIVRQLKHLEEFIGAPPLSDSCGHQLNRSRRRQRRAPPHGQVGLGILPSSSRRRWRVPRHGRAYGDWSGRRNRGRRS